MAAFQNKNISASTENLFFSRKFHIFALSEAWIFPFKILFPCPKISCMPSLNTLSQCRISNNSSQTKTSCHICRLSGLVPFFYVTVLYRPFSPPCHLFSCQHGEATVQCIHGNQSVFDVTDCSSRSCLPPLLITFTFSFHSFSSRGDCL